MPRSLPRPEFALQWIAVFVSLAGLALIYLFQQFDYFDLIRRVVGADTDSDPNVPFIVNRTLRLILNDLLCLVLILNFFHDSRFTRVAMYVFLAELFLLLPAYLAIKLTLEGPSEISSPLLSPIHRMIVNPLLMVILIAGFYYQRWHESKAA